MLHAPVHNVDRAKYYVIDVHNHVNDAMGIDDHMPPERVVEIMNNTNVKTVVILTGMWGDKLQKVIDEMVKPYPGRFMVFCADRLEQDRRSQLQPGDGGAARRCRGARARAA